METAAASFGQLTATSQHFARRLLTVGENRLEQSTVEMQAKRGRLPPAVLLAFGVPAPASVSARRTALAAVLKAAALAWPHSLQTKLCPHIPNNNKANP